MNAVSHAPTLTPVPEGTVEMGIKEMMEYVEQKHQQNDHQAGFSVNNVQNVWGFPHYNNTCKEHIAELVRQIDGELDQMEYIQRQEEELSEKIGIGESAEALGLTIQSVQHRVRAQIDSTLNQLHNIAEQLEEANNESLLDTEHKLEKLEQIFHCQVELERQQLGDLRTKFALLDQNPKNTSFGFQNWIRQTLHSFQSTIGSLFGYAKESKGEEIKSSALSPSENREILLEKAKVDLQEILGSVETPDQPVILQLRKIKKEAEEEIEELVKHAANMPFGAFQLSLHLIVGKAKEKVHSYEKNKELITQGHTISANQQTIHTLISRVEALTNKLQTALTAVAGKTDIADGIHHVGNTLNHLGPDIDVFRQKLKKLQKFWRVWNKILGNPTLKKEDDKSLMCLAVPPQLSKEKWNELLGDTQELLKELSATPEYFQDIVNEVAPIVAAMSKSVDSMEELVSFPRKAELSTLIRDKLQKCVTKYGNNMQQKIRINDINLGESAPLESSAQVLIQHGTLEKVLEKFFDRARLHQNTVNLEIAIDPENSSVVRITDKGTKLQKRAILDSMHPTEIMHLATSNPYNFEGTLPGTEALILFLLRKDISFADLGKFLCSQQHKNKLYHDICNTIKEAIGMQQEVEITEEGYVTLTITCDSICQSDLQNYEKKCEKIKSMLKNSDNTQNPNTALIAEVVHALQEFQETLLPMLLVHKKEKLLQKLYSFGQSLEASGCTLNILEPMNRFLSDTVPCAMRQNLMPR